MWIITKPDWMESFLSYLNWDIFGWHIDVGGILEVAIDWIINYLNYAIQYAQMTYNSLQVIYSWVIDAITTLKSDIFSLFESLSNSITSAVSSIREYLVVLWQNMVDYVTSFKDDIFRFLNDFRTNIDNLFQLWDNFRTNILPQLVNYATLVSFRSSIMNDIAEPINSWVNIRDEVIEFFTMPSVWLAKRIAKILEDMW